MEAQRRAPAAGEDPSPATAESRSTGTEESQWLAILSEPELDFLISLKVLAVKRAETAGYPHLAHAFDLRTLRAVGVVLLEGFKERLRETTVDPAVLDRLALSIESDAGFSVSCSDSEVFRPRKYQPTRNSVKKKGKQIHNGHHATRPRGPRSWTMACKAGHAPEGLARTEEASKSTSRPLALSSMKEDH